MQRILPSFHALKDTLAKARNTVPRQFSTLLREKQCPENFDAKLFRETYLQGIRHQNMGLINEI